MSQDVASKIWISFHLYNFNEIMLLVLDTLKKKTKKIRRKLRENGKRGCCSLMEINVQDAM